MDALEEIVEGELTVHGDHDLRVEDERGRGHGEDSLHDLWEVAGERLPRLDWSSTELVATEDEAAKAVPLRLVLPACSLEEAHGRGVLPSER